MEGVQPTQQDGEVAVGSVGEEGAIGRLAADAGGVPQPFEAVDPSAVVTKATCSGLTCQVGGRRSEFHAVVPRKRTSKRSQGTLRCSKPSWLPGRAVAERADALEHRQ